jgi:hypothetical protein
MDNAKPMAKGLQRAASLLGKRSWEARLKRFGPRKLRQLMSVASKAAKRTGRPRLPDDQVKPNTLYQRERRAQLRAKMKSKKGGIKHGEDS